MSPPIALGPILMFVGLAILTIATLFVHRRSLLFSMLIVGLVLFVSGGVAACVQLGPPGFVDRMPLPSPTWSIPPD